jgi:molecular chaperone DnaK (HSP70)
LSEPLTPAGFKEFNLDLLRKTMAQVQQVLADARGSQRDVDEIALVGGSRRLPKVHQLISDLFIGKTLCARINADQALANGAAAEGAVLSDDPDAVDIAILNSDFHALGAEAVGGAVTELIPARSKL